MIRLAIGGSRWIPVGACLLIVDAALRVHRLQPDEVLIAVDGTEPVGPAAAASAWALARGVTVRPFYARWAELGDAAGDERRDRLATSATHLLALWDGMSSGTADLVARCRRRRIAVVQLEIVPSSATAARLDAERKRARRRPIPALTRALAPAS